MGTGDIALPSLQWLLEAKTCKVVGVFTQPDRPVGRKLVLTPPKTKVLAQNAGIPVFQPERLREENAMQSLRELEPDLIVVMAYGQILKKEVIDLPTIACVNLHASILPRHRGAAPIQGAIRDGDAESGITLMHIDVGLDSGDIILIERCPIEETETGETLHDKLADLAPVALAKGVEQFSAKTATHTPQVEAEVTHIGKLTREDGEIDWTKSATEIERLIRAYDPWPGTYTKLSGTKLKVFPQTEVVSMSGTPGEILISTNGDLVAACGKNALKVSELQLEGRKRLNVEAFLAGSADQVPVGTMLG